LAPFSLAACELLLTRDGAPVGPSTRAFYVLATSLSRANEVIGKSDLIDQVWPGIAVEEGSLRFHIANLRKVRGDGNNGAHFITTAPTSSRRHRGAATALWRRFRGANNAGCQSFRKQVFDWPTWLVACSE
jgi:DNA-binding response OmpR family regulator